MRELSQENAVMAARLSHLRFASRSTSVDGLEDLQDLLQTLPDGPHAVSVLSRLHQAPEEHVDLTRALSLRQETVDELRAALADMLATSEALQRTNSLLQARCEGLQAELRAATARTALRAEAETDLQALFRASRVAAVCVDDRLVMRRFTPEAASLLALRPEDVGSPWPERLHRLGDVGLRGILLEALKTRMPHSHEIESGHGRRHRVTVLAHSAAHTPGRAWVVFSNVSTARRAELIEQALDAQPANTVLLDTHGRIVWTNRAWRGFAGTNGGRAKDVSLGTDHLAQLDQAAAGDEPSRRAAHALRAVLAGELPGFVDLYACHAPFEQRWFMLQIHALGEPVGGAVVSHLNVTGWLQTAGSSRSGQGGGSQEGRPGCDA